jgi:hypothetical protein
VPQAKVSGCESDHVRSAKWWVKMTKEAKPRRPSTQGIRLWRARTIAGSGCGGAPPGGPCFSS